MVCHMLDDVASEFFLTNACSSGKFENGSDSLPKCGSIFLKFRKSLERKRKKKKTKAALDSKE